MIAENHQMTVINLATILIYNVYARSKDTLLAEDYPTDMEVLPSACNDLEDGYHWIDH